MIGKEVGNYRILKELGRGGMGVVYKANQTTLGRMVAMKMLPQHLTSDASFIKRFENEARAIAKLNHPNIVQIYDIGRQDEIHYYTMEFIEGSSLDDIIYKEGFLPLDHAINIVSQVARALQYAHSRGIVHRDIKPSNIMIDKSGRVKVTDFGLALQERTTRLTMEGSIVGTPEYMSPEQAVAEPATARSDIYSLGVVFYELLTGKVPFEGETALMVLRKIETSEPEWPRAINPDVPVEVERVIRTMMAKKPRDRYGSCQELIRDLKRLSMGQPVPVRTRGPTHFQLLAAAVVCLLLMAGAVAGYRTLVATRQKAAPPELSKTRVSPTVQPPQRMVETPTPPPLPQRPSPPAPPEPPPSPAPPSPEETLAELDRQLAALKEQVETLRSRKGPPEALWADQILFKKGNKISCEIAGESLEKVRIRTDSGLADIPRDEIKLTVYATPEQKKRAEDARAEEQERLQEEQRVRSAINMLEARRTALDKEYGLKQAKEEAEPVAKATATTPGKTVPASARNDNQSPEHSWGGRTEAVPIPLTEKNWHAQSDCKRKEEVSFDNDSITISISKSAENTSCATTVRTTDPVEGGLDTIEILVEIRRLVHGQDDKVISSLIVGFADGKSVEYVLYDSQLEQPEEEIDETPDSLRISRPELSILANKGWHSLLLPVANDIAKIKGGGKIENISLVNRQMGPIKGLFVFRYKTVLLNKK